MPTITLALPVAGTNIAAGLHATNYAALQTLLNGGLDNTNLAAGAAIAVTKIAPGANGQALITSGGVTAWGSTGMTLIDDLTVTGSVLASYDTNTRLGGNIPATYKHLKLIVAGKTDQAGDQFISCRINNDSTANYHNVLLTVATGSVVGSEAIGGTTWSVVGALPRSAGNHGNIEILLPNYAGGVLGVGFLSDSSVLSNNVSGQVKRYQASGGHGILTTINRIALTPTAGNFLIGTRFSLYGIS